MGRKNRAYKKAKPHRDARLFLVICEGKREERYFRFFQGKSLRFDIKIVPQEENRSAPSHFLGRLHQFQKNGEWEPKADDQLWFVLDVDQWKREAIEDLRQACQRESNWNIAISNPCFEVWLLFHYLEAPIPEATCKALKQQLHLVSGNQSSPDQMARLIAKAAIRARSADDLKENAFPDHMCTKVYFLAEQLIERLGATWEMN